MTKESSLEREVEKLREDNRQLKDEIDRLKNVEKQFEHLKKEFEEFKAKHGVTVDNLKEAMKIKANSAEKKKTPGAKKDHKGYARIIPARIDYVKPLKAKTCPHCNRKLKGKTQEIRTRHVTDIKLVSEAKTTKYEIHRDYCTYCKKLVEPEVPNVLPRARFGLNLMLLIMYLRLGLRIPGNKVCDFLQTMYNLSISEGEIVHILKQLVIAFGDHYAYLEKIIKLARVKHTDSTSWRVDGKNYFAWVFIACGVVLYKIRKRNNSKSPLTVFGTKQKGNTLVVDRHSALRALAEKAGFLLQYCWSHILADSKDLAKNFGAEGEYVHRRLKQIYELAKGLAGVGLTEHIDQLNAEILQLTLRHYKSNTVRRFVDNLWYRDRANLFRFIMDPDVDPTNNISERELRALVIIRKISNGSRSRRGANATAMLLSIIQTLRMKNQNVLLSLKGILNGTSEY